MGTVAPIVGGLSAVIALVGIAYIVYCCYRKKADSGPRSPKQGAGRRCPRSILCASVNAEPDLEQGVVIGVPTSASSSHTAFPRMSSGGPLKLASNISPRSTKAPPPQVKSTSYSFEEMRTATKQFERKIGEGRFGPVYHGQLPDGQEVAIKVISKNSGQGTGEFVKEVDLVANLHHGNLVALLGHCQESPHQMLVYTYIPNGTLRDHLQNRGAEKLQATLTWPQRLRIALDAAEALKYLHSVHKSGLPVTVHGDIKPNNILLDKNLQARLADFGISKFASVDNSGFPSLVVGSPGYLDPEYFSTQQLNAKSDVYSLGVVLLEMISGWPPIRLDLNGGKDSSWNLIEWARSLIKEGKLEMLVDPALNGTYNKDSLAKVAELAMFSVEPQGVNRPKACKIVEGLATALDQVTTRPRTQSTGRGSATKLDLSKASNSCRSIDSRYSGAESEALISFPSTQSLEALEASQAPSSPANICIQVDAR